MTDKQAPDDLFSSKNKNSFEGNDTKKGMQDLLKKKSKGQLFKNARANYGNVKLTKGKTNKKNLGFKAKRKLKPDTDSRKKIPKLTDGTPQKGTFSKKLVEPSHSKEHVKFTSKSRQSQSKKKNSVPTPIAKTNLVQATKKMGGVSLEKNAVNVLAQDEDLEAVHHFKSSYDKGKGSFEAGKKVHAFMTKGEKFSRRVSVNKVNDLRFGSKGVNSSFSNSASNAAPNGLAAKLRQIRQKSFQMVQKYILAIIKNPYILGFIGMVVGGFALLSVGIILFSSLSNQDESNSSLDGLEYVKHWSGRDAYTSSLLAQRYGITEQQIDGFIKSQGYEKVDARASGKEFLRLQKISGIDVRALVAFAQMESSYGTAGVAADFPKGNIFGFGAFDNDPNQGANWDNTRAVKEFRDYQIDTLGNKTVKIMDQRAEAFANHTLKPGEGVYWTALYSGKKRAAVMQDFDMYIDAHGGTPDPPGGYGPVGGNGGAAGIKALDEALGKSIAGTYGGADGQCYALTSFYAHSVTENIPNLVGGMNASNIGSDYPWDKWGWKVVNTPNYKQIKAGDIINFAAGADMGGWRVDPTYGHTGVVGKVLGDDRLIIYDQNPGPAKTWTWTYTNNSVASVIHPPK